MLNLYIHNTGTVPAADNSAPLTDGSYTSSAQGCLSEVTVTVTAVSYTHLDVYKRQVVYIGVFRYTKDKAACPFKAGAFHARFCLNFNKLIRDCLLYTSRCV